MREIGKEKGNKHGLAIIILPLAYEGQNIEKIFLQVKHLCNCMIIYTKSLNILIIKENIW